MTLPQRVVGLALVLFVLFPVHRLLDPAQTGPRRRGDKRCGRGRLGSGPVGLVDRAYARMGRDAHAAGCRTICADTGAGLARSSPTNPRGIRDRDGGSCLRRIGIIAHRVHGLAPTTVDEMVQLLHAALLAGGSLTLPTGEAAAAWLIQNGVMTEAGWASIYPPFHTILLALGLTAGVPWLMGPLMTAIATGASTWVIERVAGVGEWAARRPALVCLSVLAAAGRDLPQPHHRDCVFSAARRVMYRVTGRLHEVIGHALGARGRCSGWWCRLLTTPGWVWCAARP